MKNEEENQYTYTSRTAYIKLIQQVQRAFPHDTTLANMSADDLRSMLQDVVGEGNKEMKLQINNEKIEFKKEFSEQRTQIGKLDDKLVQIQTSKQ